MRTCQIDGCDRPHRARGWCMLHYTRWRKTGAAGEATLHRVPHGITTCIVDGCDGDTNKGGRGYCAMHWGRVKRTGEVGPAGHVRKPGRSTAERVFSKVVEDGECWIWTGAGAPGHGRIGVGSAVHLVHRWVYEHMVGPIPEGLVIDHTCCRPSCVNPEHLDPVPDAVNKQRGGLTHGLRRVSS